MGRVLGSCRRFLAWPFIIVNNVRLESWATLPNLDQMSSNFVVDAANIGTLRETVACMRFARCEFGKKAQSIQKSCE
jgi:hypothetical protein